LDLIPANYTQTTDTYNPSWVKCLSLRRNRMFVLDATISHFKRLTALDISDNGLLEIPGALMDLKSLKILSAKNNALETSSWPKNFGAQMDRLQVLNLSGNQMDELPETVLELRMLKFLHLGANRLQSLPCKIGDMAKYFVSSLVV